MTMSPSDILKRLSFATDSEPFVEVGDKRDWRITRLGPIGAPLAIDHRNSTT